MATNAEQVREWREKACDEIRQWVESQGHGTRARIAKKLGLSPSRVSRCLDPSKDDAGSPEFVRQLQAAYPQWRPLWIEYQRIIDPATYQINQGVVDRAMDALREAERDIILNQLEELETEAKELISRIVDTARRAAR